MSNTSTPTRSKPQYHYFYGSTGDESSPSVEVAPRPFSPGGSESDALVGESLVPTDTEEETQTNSEQDLQQLIVTNGKNGLLPPLVGTSVSTSSPHLPRAEVAGPIGRFGRACRDIFCGGRNSSAGHVTRVFLAIVLTVCLLVLAVVVFPYGFRAAMARTDPAGSGNGATRSFPFIPFPKVDRINYNDPASNIVHLDLFDPSLFYQGTRDKTHRGIGNAIDPLLKVPFPTGAFWSNLILKPTADRGFSYPIVVYPYAYKWSDDELQTSYPALHRRVDSISIRDAFIPDLTFGTNESVVRRHITSFDPLSVTARFTLDSSGFWETYLVQGSPYITIKVSHATPVIRALSIFRSFGCPVDSDDQYDGADAFNISLDDSDDAPPNLRRRLKWGVSAPSSESPLVTDQNDSEGVSLHGVQFILQTQEGQTWIIFSSEPIGLTFNTLRKTTVTATNKFSGVLRLALIPPPPGSKKGGSTASGMVPLSTSSGLRRLIYHSKVYPTSGKVSWDIAGEGSSVPSLSTTLSNAASDASFGSPKPSGSKTATIKFEFATESMTDNSNSRQSSVHDDLLMLSLPHHAQLLKGSNTLTSNAKFDLTYQCITGSMTPVLGDTWTYDENLTTIGFDDFDVENFKSGMNEKVRSAILDSLDVDLNRVLPTLDENVYGFGKQVARLAQLAHIASVVESPQSSSRVHGHTKDTNSSVPLTPHLSTATQKLQSFLQEFLNNQVADTLLYDAKFGGVVTRNGLLDTDADFGNGRYNDHHFHYGYVLYACAIMGHLNSTFVLEYGSYVDALLFDIAHSSNGDSNTVDGVFFPLARHMSWFDGHSFASGLFPFGNGKSQESSSEAVNAYYGAYLWSMVRESHGDSGSDLSDFARLLLAMEIRGAKSYWHMTPPPKTNVTSLQPSLFYNPTFSENYMVGNLGMLDAVCSTWFGTEQLYVHMINFLPVTGITSELFDKTYVKQEFEHVIEPLLSNTEMAWKGYVISDHAILDPSAAWTEAQSLVSYELDAAISKSQVLYWISTRNGFSIATSTSSDEQGPSAAPKTDESTPDTSSAKCEDHAGCVALGLSGLCCPSSDGTMLFCCSTHSQR